MSELPKSGSSGELEPEKSAVRLWVLALLAVIILVVAVPIIRIHTRERKSDQATTEMITGNPPGDAIKSSASKPEARFVPLPTVTPSVEPIIAQTNITASPVTNVPAPEDPAEQLLRRKIQELEERVHELEAALSAAKLPQNQPDTTNYQKPAPGTWVATDGTASRIIISPMNDVGPWLKIQALGLGINNVNDWGEVPLDYRSDVNPVGFAAWHKGDISLFLILRFVPSGINLEAVYQIGAAPNVSAKVVDARKFFVPVSGP